MEMLRTQLSLESVAEYFTSLATVLDGIPTSFVWNMDEFGPSDWLDAQANTVYNPSDCSTDIVPVAVSQTGKRIILIGYICGDGSHAKPMVIISRHTVDLDLTLLGVLDRNWHICHRPNRFIDRALFERWFVNIFLKEIAERRPESHYDGPAMLIIDGCTAHDGDFFLDLCMEQNIIPIPIPLHSSHFVQSLNLIIFGVTKRLITRLNKIEQGNV
jgi:hypothetical protein